MSNPMPTTKRRVDSGGPDFYPTPVWCTEALLRVESFEGTSWEPACGDGAISKVIEATGHNIISTDLYDRGYGCADIDFLDPTGWGDWESGVITNIITNPPYALAEKFVLKALNITTRKVAFLLRLAFLESITRYDSIFSQTPPTRVWVFSERVTMYPNGEQTAGSGTTTYAWFVWDKKDSDYGMFSFFPINPTKLGWIPPGSKPKAPKRSKVPLLGLKLSDLGLGGNDSG